MTNGLVVLAHCSVHQKRNRVSSVQLSLVALYVLFSFKPGPRSRTKKEHELLRPTSGAPILHAFRANYQAKIWLPAARKHIDSSPPMDTSSVKKHYCPIPVWTRLPPIPDSCIWQLVTWLCWHRVSCVEGYHIIAISLLMYSRLTYIVFVKT